MHHARLFAATLLLAFFPLSGAEATFSSIYVFGDGVCTTTATPTPADQYHEGRFCNGKVWVEVLSKWQGVTYSTSNNLSYFGHNSAELKDNATAFEASEDVATSLFIVWCNDADFVDFVGIYDSSDDWTGVMNQSIADHVAAITTLYDKGVRVILAPNAVDVMETPFYINSVPSERTFARDRVIEYNGLFEAAMNDLMASKPGLKILCADTFGFFDQVIASPEDFGLINPPAEEGNAGFDIGDGDLNGAGANYVFWDDYHPTAKFQMHLADFFQKIISPMKVSGISRSGSNVQLQVANVPFERAGTIQGSADLQSPWTTDWTIDESFVEGGSTTKTYAFPAAGPKRFYRVGFPVVWTWP